MTLIIDGQRAIASGTVMIPPHTRGAIELPGGTVELTFDTTGDPGFTWDHWHLTVRSPENPLGIGLQIPLERKGDSQSLLSLTIHTVGSAGNVHRIIHYTAYVGP